MFKFSVNYCVLADVMKIVLDALQSNEEARIRCIRSALRKLIVFETSLIANRGYDMRGMAATMEEIDVAGVISEFISSVRQKHGNQF